MFFFFCLQISPAFVKRDGSGRNLLELFHVCPLLFREKMEASCRPSLGGPPNTRRSVYRYVFCCPGEAQALVSVYRGLWREWAFERQLHDRESTPNFPTRFVRFLVRFVSCTSYYLQ